MYSTCLFCTKALGRNDALEHFPVGRRLAYDAAKGRLWVICRRCERWNLTPLETRWEAIDEAERAFRATRMRIGTDSISLARLNEGLELVRIGTPPRLELASWRYGDQFGRRRRKYFAIGAAGLAAGLSPVVGMVWGGAFLATTGAALAFDAMRFHRFHKEKHDGVVFVPYGDGDVLGLTPWDIKTAELARVPEVGDWCLTVQRATLREHLRRELEDDMIPAYKPRLTLAATMKVILRGDDAQRALASMLPYLNRTGGSARRVREAVDVIASSPSLHHLLYSAAESHEHRGATTANHITALPARTRLALEMVLHEDDERRAMEGELSLLEQRWREAEEIASIADSLLVPADADERFEALRRVRDTSRKR